MGSTGKFSFFIISVLLILFAVQVQSQSNQADLATIQDMQQSFRSVAQKVLPVVVEINVISVSTQNIPRALSPFEFFLNPSPDGGTSQEREFRQPGLGSGVIVHRKSDHVYILTNNHVIGNADEISVQLYDERQFEAKTVGKDARLDLALIEFTTNDEIQIASLGDSDSLQVGDLVFAFGNPYGFESTVTAGIVSALGRRADPNMAIASFTDYIQTDAAIHHGNSGGALVNIYGEIIGINTWIASQTGASIGLGFAIPVNMAKRAIKDFLERGKIVYGWLGVSIADLIEVPGSAEDFKIGSQTGSLILNIYKNSPAEKDGILPGDFILRVNNAPIQNKTEFSAAIGNIAPGDRAALTLLRNGKQQRLSVTLEERESEDALQSNVNLWPGFVAYRLTDAVRNSYRLAGSDDGIIIIYVSAESPAATAGMQQFDMVKSVNRKRIRTLLDLYSNMNSASGRTIEIEISREETTVRLNLPN